MLSTLRSLTCAVDGVKSNRDNIGVDGNDVTVRLNEGMKEVLEARG